MRSAMLLGAAMIAALPAHADGIRLGECVANGGTSECAVTLAQGQDYLFRYGAGGDFIGTAELVDPAGRAVFKVISEGGDSDLGREFRAAYSAQYRIRVAAASPEDSMDASISTDCKAATGTRCKLATGGSSDGRLSSSTEHDWYKASLASGRVYAFTLSTANYCEIWLRNKEGNIVAKAHSDGSGGTIRYRARYSGAYYLDVSKGTAYTVSLK